MANRIELSKGFLTGNGSLTERMLNLGGQDHWGGRVASYGLLTGHPNTVFSIMKGLVPTNVYDFDNGTFRDSDKLINFKPVSGHFSASQFSVNPVIISTIFVPAEATGTATWFLLRSDNYLGGGGIQSSLFGTVGVIGSGADLEMADVNILSGDNYRISAMKLEFPSSWEF